MTVGRSLEKELELLPLELRDSSLAELARTLAGKLDDIELPARETAAISKEFRGTLAELREIADQKPADADPIDEIKRRRERRAAGE